MTIGKIIQIARDNGRLNPQEECFVRKAYDFSVQAHRGQKRKSREPYINHPLRVAHTLAVLGVDYTTLAAGFLHDVLEETAVTKQQLEKVFCSEIADLVEGVTKVKKVAYDDTDYQVASLNKTLSAIAGDVRVVIIRLADRLDNMTTLETHSKAKREKIATETLDIFSPIAERLGIGRLKGDLEDLSFYYLLPKIFQKLKGEADAKMKEKSKHLVKIKHRLYKILKKEGIIPDDIDLRSKHYYSLYRKLQRRELDLDQVEDLVVIRVKVNTVNQCYLALRAIHKNFKFIPGRIKDYIALPKANGYQALHTVVFDKHGGITEIQIKTMQMHERSNLGVIMNLDYLKNRQTDPSQCIRNMEWLQRLKGWQSEAYCLPKQDFYDILKSDFLKDRIVVFDQNGNVYDLPEGATIIDFSFTSQGERGLHTYKGKVNNEPKVLCHRLKNGDIIEIGYDKRVKLKKNLLGCAKTTIARRFLSSAE